MDYIFNTWSFIVNFLISLCFQAATWCFLNTCFLFLPHSKRDQSNKLFYMFREKQRAHMGTNILFNNANCNIWIILFIQRSKKKVIYPWRINHTVCVKSKSNTIFSTSTIKGKLTQRKLNVHSFNVGPFVLTLWTSSSLCQDFHLPPADGAKRKPNFMSKPVNY